jgi:hypothetical protein
VATVNCMREERDHTYLLSAEKVSVKPFAAGSTERKISEALTPFACTFVLKQLNLCASIEVSLTGDTATVSTEGRSHVVTASDCSCSFVGCMGLPCKHIFAVRKFRKTEMFTLDGIWSRWIKKDVMESHRVFHRSDVSTTADDGNAVKVSQVRNRPMTVSQKFQRCKRVVQRLVELASEGNTDLFNSRLSTLQTLVQLWESGATALICTLTDEGVQQVPVDRSDAYEQIMSNEHSSERENTETDTQQVLQVDLEADDIQTVNDNHGVNQHTNSDVDEARVDVDSGAILQEAADEAMFLSEMTGELQATSDVDEARVDVDSGAILQEAVDEAMFLSEMTGELQANCTGASTVPVLAEFEAAMEQENNTGDESVSQMNMPNSVEDNMVDAELAEPSANGTLKPLSDINTNTSRRRTVLGSKHSELSTSSKVRVASENKVNNLLIAYSVMK